MKFCMLSGADFNGKVTAHSNNIFDWPRLFGGEHRSILSVRENKEVLDEYDVVLFVDCDRYIEDAIQIAKHQDCKTIFCPEGTINYFTKMPFDHQRLFYELLQEVDLIGAFEEDRIPWYESLWDTPAFFLHVPITDKVINAPKQTKTDRILVCCNLGMDQQRYPTNVITSLGVIKAVKKPCLLCEPVENQVWFFKDIMGIENLDTVSRIAWDHYLEHIVAPSVVMLNPSDMIGTSRNAIFGAGCGTPVIGNMHSHTQARLFPHLGTYIYDSKRMIELTMALYTDQSFYEDVCDHAAEEVSYYSEENTKARFLEALEL